MTLQWLQGIIATVTELRASLDEEEEGGCGLLLATTESKKSDVDDVNKKQ